jgi:DNA-binding transcriptional ArsR family regulator
MNAADKPAGRTQARAALPENVVELTAQRLRVIAEPTRISLLEALNVGEAGVQELADQIDRPHRTASHHLILLWRAGLVSRRQEGSMTLYALSDWSAWWVVEQIARWVQTCQDEQGASAPTE